MRPILSHPDSQKTKYVSMCLAPPVKTLASLSFIQDWEFYVLPYINLLNQDVVVGVVVESLALAVIANLMTLVIKMSAGVRDERSVLRQRRARDNGRCCLIIAHDDTVVVATAES